MKIKLNKKSGVVAHNPKNVNQSFKYVWNDVILIKGSSNDLFEPNKTHFLNSNGYVFELNKEDFEIV